MRFSGLLKGLGCLLLTLLIAIITLWTSLALFYQLPLSMNWRIIAITFWLALSLATTLSLYIKRLHDYRRPTLIIFGFLFFLIIIWWSQIKPTLYRDWALDVSQTVTAEFDVTDKNIVALQNIRDFDWRTEEDFTPQWKTAEYDLSQLQGIDLFLSYWGSPAIAHTLVSFGFQDGRQVVFSAEIRKDQQQSFSEVGGFFKDFELALIAAEESDIVYLRTNVRGERVYRYPINITPELARELFLLYADKANTLAQSPGFYNTLTANCTTVVFDMARVISPDVAFDYRVLLSGYLPEYLYDYNLTNGASTVEQRHEEANINQLAIGDREGYSTRIRQ